MKVRKFMIKCDFCEHSKPHSIFNTEFFRCAFIEDEDFSELKHKECSKAIQKMQKELSKNKKED
jgi:hypothetical protein